MVICGLRLRWCVIFVLVGWIATVILAQSQGRVRRGPQRIRTRLTSGIPLRRVTSRVFYEPIYAASEAVSGGYSYPSPVILQTGNEQEEEIDSGFDGQTTTVVAERPTTEVPEPVAPEADFVQGSKTGSAAAVAIESEQDIDADSIYPEPTVKPTKPQKQASLQSSGSAAAGSKKNGDGDDGSHGHNHGDDVWPDGYKGVIPGEEGVDYPVYSTIPETSFNCNAQQYSGYYADEEARCQVFHVCLRRQRRRSIEHWKFLCPNGTVFSQEDFVCVWWNNAPTCDSATLSRLYTLNENLGWDSHVETKESIKSIMENIVQMQTLPMSMMSTTPSILQARDPLKNAPRTEQKLEQPEREVNTNERQRPNRIPVKLTASLGSPNNKQVNIAMTVPITSITPDQISTVPDNTNDNDNGEIEDENETDVNIDSQVTIDTRTESQKEARKKTKTGSATLKSQSEAYEQFGDPGALDLAPEVKVDEQSQQQEVPEPAKPFIVNRDSSLKQMMAAEEILNNNDNDNDAPSTPSSNDLESNDRAVPTLMMMPVEQRYPDGTTSVIEMPVMIMMKPRGFPPVAVTNPRGITIPNKPNSPPRNTYLPPKANNINDILMATTFRPESTTTTTTTNNPTTTTTLSPRGEEEPQNDVDYIQDPDKEPPGSKPVIDYEINSDSVQPVTGLMETTTRLPVQSANLDSQPSNGYLPPPPANRNNNNNNQPMSTTTTRPVTETESPTTTESVKTTTVQPTIDTDTEVINSLDDPVVTYDNNNNNNNGRPNTGTFVAMDGALVNQILQQAGIMDQIQDGKDFIAFKPSSEMMEEMNVQYPTPEGAVDEATAKDVGTDSQLYNANVRTLYSKKTPAATTTATQNPNVNADSQMGLPTYNMEKNNMLLKQIQYGSYEERNKLTDGLEKITPGYIELPPNPTQSSPSDLPGTERVVQAFLTSQKNVDPKQTLEIFQFPVLKNNNNGVQGGTPAPAGLVQGGYSSGPSSSESSVESESEMVNPVPAPVSAPAQNQEQNDISSLFGPLARDALKNSQKSEQEQQQQQGGYNYNSPNQQEQQQSSQNQEPQQPEQPQNQQQQQETQTEQPQIPAGLYGVPSREFSANQQQSQQQSGQGGYNNQQQQSQQSGQGGYNNNNQEQQQQAQQSSQGGYTNNNNNQPRQQQQQQQQQSGGYSQNQNQNQNQVNGGYNNNNNNNNNNNVRPPSGLYQLPRQQASIIYDAPVPSLSQHATFTFPQPQLQLPVVVETHTSHSVPFEIPPQQQQLFYQPNQQLGQANLIPSPPPQPSGLYQTPLFDHQQHQQLLQPQSTVFTNTIQLPQNSYPGLRATSNPEVIQAIPVHSSTIVETRPIGNQRQNYISNNNLIPQQQQPQQQQQHQQQYFVQPQLQSQYPLPTPTRSTNNYQQQQPQQQQQQQQQGYNLNSLNAQDFHQQQINKVRLQHQQLQQLSHPPQYQLNREPAIQVQQAQVRQIHYSPQESRAFPQGTHYNRNTATQQIQQQQVSPVANNVQVQPQAHQSQVTNGQKLLMFNANDGVRQNNNNNNQVAHQSSHQQHVQNFINQQNQRFNTNNNVLQYGVPGVQRTIALDSVASPSSSSPAIGVHSHHQQQQYQQQHQQFYYPGRDKSAGIKLTYD